MVTLNLEVLTRTAQRPAHNGVRLRVPADQLGPSPCNASDRSSAARGDYYGVNGHLKAVAGESSSKVGSRGRLATRGATTCW